jgi:antitoxin YefM
MLALLCQTPQLVAIAARTHPAVIVMSSAGAGFGMGGVLQTDQVCLTKLDTSHQAGHLAGFPWTPGEKLVILMTMPEVSSLAEVKAHLSELVARVGDQHERITVTVHGRPTAVLLAVDDLESLEETIAVLSDPAALRALGEADVELARGVGENQDSLAAAMQARRART